MRYLLLLVLAVSAIANSQTRNHDVIVEGSVAAAGTLVDLFAVIPLNKKVRLKRFGGYDPIINGDCGIIAIQYNDGSGFDTVRAGGCGAFEYSIERDFVGNGTSTRFRIIRQNLGATAKQMQAYGESVIFD